MNNSSLRLRARRRRVHADRDDRRDRAHLDDPWRACRSVRNELAEHECDVAPVEPVERRAGHLELSREGRAGRRRRQSGDRPERHHPRRVHERRADVLGHRDGPAFSLGRPLRHRPPTSTPCTRCPETQLTRTACSTPVAGGTPTTSPGIDLAKTIAVRLRRRARPARRPTSLQQRQRRSDRRCPTRVHLLITATQNKNCRPARR